MYSYYISAATGAYYEGDRAHALDTEVPQRPDHRATWDGSEWVLDSGKIASDDAQQKIAEMERVGIPEQKIDGGYIRGLREYMLGGAQMFNLCNQIIASLEATIREIGGPTYADFTAPRLPDITQTPGMQKVKTLDDTIKAQRALIQ